MLGMGAEGAVSDLFGGGAAAILPPTMRSNPPDVYLNLKKNQAYLKSGNKVVSASSLLTITRASPATQVDSQGVWHQFANNVPAITDVGIALWESRTNRIRNNTMQGAVAGSPGTLPTNWSVVTNGLTQQIIGVSQINGVDCLTIRYSGTATGTAVNLLPETSTHVGAALGQTWALSAFMSIVVNGGTAPASFNLELDEMTSGGSFLQGTVKNFAYSNVLQRVQGSRTFINANVAAARPQLAVPLVNGSTYDFTLTVGWPQIENALGASSVQVPVASASIVNGGTGGTYAVNDLLSVVGGTGTTAVLKVTSVSTGVITGISVQTAGGYSTYPAMPCSVTGGGGTGATFNLTPTDESSVSGASNPILTTGSVDVNRPAETCILSLPGFTNPGTAYSLYSQFRIQMPASYGTFSPAGTIGFDDGTTNNRIGIRGTSIIAVNTGSTTVSLNSSGGTSLQQGVYFKTAAAFAVSDQEVCTIGGGKATGTSATIPTTALNTIRLGSSAASASQFVDGDIAEVAVWLGQRVPEAQLQAMVG